MSGSDFNFGVTNDPSGQNFSQSEPTLGAGAMDMFVITGVTDPSLVENVGVRIQSLAGDVNGGSLFLVGEEEQATPNGNGIM